MIDSLSIAVYAFVSRVSMSWGGNKSLVDAQFWVAIYFAAYIHICTYLYIVHK